ncbi:MAG: hypothetical protein KDB10_08765 [Acidimicrobiales bacterium]|nr:hypothetical protein [Acidimicrobiales bacterium]MCB9371440.1 AbrB family transcriptional regulator [Microthrixaceae bacterium]
MVVHVFHDLDPDSVRTVEISQGGQISIPAAVRRRWGSRRVRVVDAGDRLIVEPVPDDPIDRARGSLRLERGLTTESLRAAGREEDAVDEGRGR